MKAPDSSLADMAFVFGWLLFCAVVPGPLIYGSVKMFGWVSGVFF